MEDPCHTLRFRAQDFPASERRAMLQEGFCRGILNIDFNPLGQDLEYEMEIRPVADVMISSGWNSAHYATNHDRSRDQDDFLLVWANSGGCISHMGQEVESREHAAFLSCGERLIAQSQATLRHRTLRLPHNVLLNLLPTALDRLARPIPLQSESFRLLDGYVSLLCREPALNPATAQLAADHICELVALVVGGTTTSTRDGRSVKAARRAAEKSWVRARLGQPQLSAREAAAAHGISERYLQLLFHAEHSTFSDFLRGERLMTARRRLANEGLRHLPISSIAFDCGFGDLSYFNRCFRALFAETPSEVRAKSGSAINH